MKIQFRWLMLVLLVGVIAGEAADKRIVLIAGKPSHRPGDHEFRAGCILLNKWLNKASDIKSEMYDMGWPKSDTVFKGADAVFIFADGGGRHPAIQQKRAQLLNALVKKGVGIGCAHYGVEVPAGDTGKTMQALGMLGPESVRVVDGAVVQLLIFFHGRNVRILGRGDSGWKRHITHNCVGAAFCESPAPTSSHSTLDNVMSLVTFRPWPVMPSRFQRAHAFARCMDFLWVIPPRRPCRMPELRS